MHKLRRREQSSILERRSIWQLLYKPAGSSYLCLCIFVSEFARKKLNPVIYIPADTGGRAV